MIYVEDELIIYRNAFPTIRHSKANYSFNQ